MGEVEETAQMWLTADIPRLVYYILFYTCVYEAKSMRGNVITQSESIEAV